MDVYRSFEHLRRHEPEGIAFRVRVRHGMSGIAVVAPHGGEIEPGTSELAEAIAGHDHHLYAFDGLLPADNDRLHITSTRFDEPRCQALLSVARAVVTVHGCGGEFHQVLLGGLDESLKDALRQSLHANGFLSREPKKLVGKHPYNLCNRHPRGAGVQLELPHAFRASLFADLSRQGRAAPLDGFHRFVNAVRQGLAVRAHTLTGMPR